MFPMTSKERKPIADKGSFSLASGRNHGPQEAFNLYRLRDASEVQYGILKSQEGFDSTRARFTSSIYAKFLICFAASCVRASHICYIWGDFIFAE